jgi:putative sugar O-methyltransferase
MLAVAFRKTRTLVDILNDFQREPLASFDTLDKGLQERPSCSSRLLLDRIMAAYQAGKRDQQGAGKEYQANGEWASRIQRKMATLSAQDLSQILDNFFRNEMFGGLADYATPASLRQRLARISFVNHMLHDYRVWSQLTGKSVEAVRTPVVGNPFGYEINGILATPGCFRRHYMAQKAVSLADREGIIAEIGGGYGELAYFALLSPGIRYLDFDLPEVLLIASYWLCQAMPNVNIALYGEGDPHCVLADPTKYDAVLYPNFCLPYLRDCSTDVFVNARSLSEMHLLTIREYLKHVARSCRRYFLHENSDEPLSLPDHTEIRGSSFEVPGFRLLSKTLAPWKAGAGRYREFLYERVC